MACRESDKSTEKKTSEALFDKVKSSKRAASCDLSDEDADVYGETYDPRKVANTLYSKRLRKRLMLEDEAERAQKGKAAIPSSGKASKTQENGNRDNRYANGFDKTENSSQSTCNGGAIKDEAAVTMGLVQSRMIRILDDTTKKILAIA